MAQPNYRRSSSRMIHVDWTVVINAALCLAAGYIIAKDIDRRIRERK